MRDVALLLGLVCMPEFGDAAAMPLSELVPLGVPYPLVAWTGDMVVGVANVLLL